MIKDGIKIPDDTALRDELVQEYNNSSQIQLCRYALMLAAHILELIPDSVPDEDLIKEGFFINEQWQQGKVRMHDVRQISLKIHQMAKTCEDRIVCSALRVVGHAVATGHMRQHALVASDYAVRVISFLHPDHMDAVRKERLWQIHQLKEIKNKGTKPTLEDVEWQNRTPAQVSESCFS